MFKNKYLIIINLSWIKTNHLRFYLFILLQIFGIISIKYFIIRFSVTQQYLRSRRASKTNSSIASSDALPKSPLLLPNQANINPVQTQPTGFEIEYIQKKPRVPNKSSSSDPPPPLQDDCAPTLTQVIRI